MRCRRWSVKRRSKMQRDKGKRGEREVVNLARSLGAESERTWQTADSTDPQQRFCDVRIQGQPYQVKLKKAGFGFLYSTLEGVRGAFLRQDGKRWLVVVDAEAYLRLIAPRGEK